MYLLSWFLEQVINQVLSVIPVGGDDGEFVARLLGKVEGSDDGKADGGDDGSKEGAPVGSFVGPALGSVVGSPVLSRWKCY